MKRCTCLKRESSSFVLQFITGQRHDLRELLEGEGGERSWTLLIGQERFDRLTQEFQLTLDV